MPAEDKGEPHIRRSTRSSICMSARLRVIGEGGGEGEARSKLSYGIGSLARQRRVLFAKVASVAACPCDSHSGEGCVEAQELRSATRTESRARMSCGDRMEIVQ